MKQAMALLCLCLLSAAAWAQQSPRSQAEAFLGALAKGQIAAAYGRLFEGSNIGPDQAQGIRRQTEASLQPLGRVLGHDLIREEQFGASLTRLVYLLRSERHATLWEFYYYRPANQWFLAEINFSQKFDAIGPKR
jgi:hypothetical protein